MLYKPCRKRVIPETACPQNAEIMQQECLMKPVETRYSESTRFPENVQVMRPEHHIKPVENARVPEQNLRKRMMKPLRTPLTEPLGNA